MISDTKQSEQSPIHEVSSCLQLHVHNDIEDAVKYYKIPLALWNKECVFIMQEDRCVFVGKTEDAKSFYELNNGKYCKSRFPI